MVFARARMGGLDFRASSAASLVPATAVAKGSVPMKGFATASRGGQDLIAAPSAAARKSRSPQHQELTNCNYKHFPPVPWWSQVCFSTFVNSGLEIVCIPPCSDKGQCISVPNGGTQCFCQVISGVVWCALNIG